MLGAHLGVKVSNVSKVGAPRRADLGDHRDLHPEVRIRRLVRCLARADRQKCDRGPIMGPEGSAEHKMRVAAIF